MKNQTKKLIIKYEKKGKTLNRSEITSDEQNKIEITFIFY